jgi:creatinine amidohydrolase
MGPRRRRRSSAAATDALGCDASAAAVRLAVARALRAPLVLAVARALRALLVLAGAPVLRAPLVLAGARVLRVPFVLAPALAACSAPHATSADASRDAPKHLAHSRGVLLEQLTWCEAEKKLGPDTIVVIPIGAQSKEHGPHLELRNDFLLAEYFKQRLLEACDVVVAPTINYNYYPAFAEYPGSTGLRLETARDLVVDVCTSLARFGPRRFYALNTGISTIKALAPAAEVLAKDGILLRYTDLESLSATAREVCAQELGSHADETETSMMLVIAPDTVDMSKAVKDCSPRGQGGLSRDPRSEKTYSPSGVWGDPTRATRAKGEKLVAALTAILVDDIEQLRRAPLPAESSAGKRP